MRLTGLEVTDLRNLERVNIPLCSGLNYFYGDNGAGKTALLEGVTLLFNGRSFRSQSTRTIIREGQSTVVVRATLEDNVRGATEVAISRDRKNTTELRLNGSKTKQMSAVAGLLSVQVMLPDISGLIFEGPALRRQLLDWGVFHVKPEYLSTLQRYQRALSQRNAALKSLATNGNVGQLSVWTDPVVEFGTSVAAMRREYFTELKPLVLQTASELAPELKVELSLKEGWDSGVSLEERLRQLSSVDVKLGATQAGPHRADLLVHIDGVRASDIASRGQGKMLASAIKLAQARLLFGKHEKESLFLIDDLGAELDEQHNRKFFQILEGMNAQILATSIHRSAGEGTYQNSPRLLFHVERGAISAQSERT